MLLGLALLALIGVSIIIAVAGAENAQQARDRRTHQALVLAKEALIGFAAAVDLATVERPGELPCPDTNDDGTADPPCSTPASRLGRLPWRTLGLPDLRDGDGERLWYAVSTNFKNNPRLNCEIPLKGTPPYPHNFGCLNSDTRGSITIRDAAGKIVHDGTEASATPTDPDPTTTGAIAVIIAPGAILTRYGASDPQTRKLNTADITTPINYLDTNGSEDNSAFADGTADGFIAGPVYDNDGRIIVNDRLMVISYNDLMPIVEQRVLREVRRCLDAYASTGNPLGLYPWAADIGQSALNDNYADVVENRFGRLPETLANSGSSSGCPASKSCMPATWPGPPQCALDPTRGWWINWRSHIFYAVAEAYKPQDTVAPPACGTCLGVTTDTGLVNDAKYFVAIAGKRLTVSGGQPRDESTKRADPNNYLEGENPGGKPDWFDARKKTASFNDVATYGK